MALLTIQPTQADIRIANAIASRTTPVIERTAGIVTWGADEKVLLALAACGWLYVNAKKPALRPIADHFLATTVVSATLPHLLKRVVDQTRPDRLTVQGHAHGVPLSGRPRDAFPSGHALHMGALASAANLLPARPRRTLRAMACGLSFTHIIAYADDEPIGTLRIRWFRDFAKFERTAFRQAYRNTHILKIVADFSFDHVARKGYDKVITHAQPKYARLWRMAFGFKNVEGKKPVYFDGHEEPYTELVKQLTPPPNAISEHTDATVLFRTEGYWDAPSKYETAVPQA